MLATSGALAAVATGVGATTTTGTEPMLSEGEDAAGFGVDEADEPFG
jgi:hypothetical protein